MNPLKHLLELILELLVLGALVELAHKVPARADGITRKGKSGEAEVLFLSEIATRAADLGSAFGDYVILEVSPGPRRV